MPRPQARRRDFEAEPLERREVMVVSSLAALQGQAQPPR